MAARCTTPAAAMHHFGGMGAPFQRWLCTIICGQVALFERRTHEDGATRKEWVMVMVQTSAEYINYPVDTSALSTMEEDAKRRERSKLRDLLLESYR